jgi:hypothetical protein
MSLILDGTAGVTGPATKVIVGTTTNDSATAGYVGEYIESVIATVPVNAVTGQYKDVASISLTAGDWDVTALADFLHAGGSSVTYWLLGISITSGNSGTGLVDGSNFTATITAATITNNVCQAIPSYRISLSSTTTVYMKVFLNYTIATPNVSARLSARRVR